MPDFRHVQPLPPERAHLCDDLASSLTEVQDCLQHHHARLLLGDQESLAQLARTVPRAWRALQQVGCLEWETQGGPQHKAQRLLLVGEEATPEWVGRILSTPYLDDRRLGRIRRAVEDVSRDLLAQLRPARPEPAAEPELPTTWPALLPVSALAARLKQTVSRVASLLYRFRKTHPDCCIPTDNPRKNEPHLLYRTADVLPFLQQRIAHGK